jgi:hypothetical protein
MQGLVQALESIESRQLNLGLYTTHITAEDLRRAIEEREGSAPSVGEVEAALRNLVAQGEAIEWAPGLFRSRIAETVRCLRLLRQRLWWQQDFSNAPLLVEHVRVEFRLRKRPKRNAVSVADAVPADMPPAVAQALGEAIGFTTFARFQAEAIREIFACAQQGNPQNESFIVSGDTGAGKTEAFLFPILLDIGSEPPELRQKPGVRAVLVYPRIRLARNQLGRLLRYIDRFRAAGGQRITVGIQNGDVPASLVPIREKWASKTEEGHTFYQVELLEACVECGAGRYWLAADDPGIETGCPRLVCDHCGHTVDTLHVTQAALERNAPDILIITDVSLSQWLAREKYTHLWGLWQGDFVTVPPRFLVLDEVHLYEQIKGAHIARLVKRFQARLRLVYEQTGEPQRYPIVIGVSATLHDERRFLAKLLDIDPQDKPRYGRLRVIKPQEQDLEPTAGRERYIFIYPRRLSPTLRSPQYRVNDQAVAIQIVMCAIHNLKTEPEWRGLAFFDSINDLRQFRHNYDADPALQWIAGYDPSGKEIPPANQDELWRIRTDRQKVENGRLKRLPNSCAQSCAERAHNATLHECPHFRAGDCWVFAKLHGWNEPLQVAGSVYAGAEPQATVIDDKDLIPTSPSLEVGYDDDAIHLIYQHKAPPSAASFIQRRGRAGRDPDDSPVIITLLWPYRRSDAFYFFHPEALYDPAFDDLPLNAGNFNVQRTHTLLAFFDLLACLRRQNIDGIAEDARIMDFTRAGWDEFAPGSDLIQSYQWLDDPKRPGQQRLVIKHGLTKEAIWISGKPIEQGWVRQEGGRLLVKGWLAMDKGLTHQVLRAAWERLSQNDLLHKYLDLSEIASQSFRTHRTYPFLIPLKGSLPHRLLNQFGDKAWHSSHDQIEWANWLKTYRHIDWMLQGNEEATTLTIHYLNPDSDQPGHEDEPTERTVDVTFGLTELLPGNISYRLRESRAIHWTPIPRDGQSTFLYPEEDSLDEAGNIVGRQSVEEFQPILSDIASQPDSIFGVPRYLDDHFPGLPFMTVKRLRVETFGPPDRQYSPTWHFDPAQGCTVQIQAGDHPPRGTFPISRRSTARANSVIVPYVAASRPGLQRQLVEPLANLFGAIDGFLTEGTAMLGYTRVFYEMQIDVKARKHEQSATLRRQFYPPQPEMDEAGRPKPVLVGYAVETHGIRFQVNPDLLDQAVDAILADEGLRLHLRRNFAIYRMAPYAAEWEVFIKTHMDVVAAVVDYWLHEVVPHSAGEPRLLDVNTDREPLIAFYAANRVQRQAEVEEFAGLLRDDLFTHLNETLQVAFKETPEFHDFLESVVLHSLSALLKNLVARLGGVGSDDLVAYADLPVLDQVDRSIDPRILIMDTVEGGSGGVAQAFERLDLTDNEGSLWWTLQTELGHCPIADGEALVQTVLTQATPGQIRDAQAAGMAETPDHLLAALGLTHPTPEARQALGHTLFNEIEVGGQSLNPALILQELLAQQAAYDAQAPGGISHEATVRRTVANLVATQQPHITALRDALQASGVAPDELDHELALQLLALYQSGCDDGCPVCLGAGSDIENYYLADLLNSRQALKKLREVLIRSAQPGDCLAELSATLLQREPVHVNAPPGGLSNRLDPSLGIAVVAQVDEAAQICSASAVAIEPEQAREFLLDGDWEQRWNKPEHKPYETPGGVRVRSRAEYIIATKLEAAGIRFEYEPRLPYTDDAGKTRFIHPDFYLYEHGLYVEYWGRDDAEYVESRRFKEQVYDRLTAQRGVRVLHLEAGDVENDEFLRKIGEMVKSS